MRFLSLVACVLLVACGSNPAPDAGGVDSGDVVSESLPDGASPDGGDVVDVTDAGSSCQLLADAQFVMPDVGSFVEATHRPLPQVPDNGGAQLTAPQLVTITYASDPHAQAFEDFGAFIVSSPWLPIVGADYGVGAGTVGGTYRIPDAPPTQITDTEVQDLIAADITAGHLPMPAGDPNNYVYMYYAPYGVTVVDSTGAAICPSNPGTFVAGYHSEYQDPTMHFAYAVINGCGRTQTPDNYGYTASHELIEAATDPYPTTSPGYSITDQSNAWFFTFGEIGDLCSQKAIDVCGHRLTRVWSNTAAASGGAPCVPVPAGDVYVQSAVPVDTLQTVHAGQVINLTVTGFSNLPTSDWLVYATLYPALSTFSPDVMLGATSLNNGTAATLTITIPTTVRSRDYATVYLVSGRNMAALINDANIWPIALYVP